MRRSDARLKLTMFFSRCANPNQRRCDCCNNYVIPWFPSHMQFLATQQKYYLYPFLPSLLSYNHLIHFLHVHMISTLLSLSRYFLSQELSYTSSRLIPKATPNSGWGCGENSNDKSLISAVNHGRCAYSRPHRILPTPQSRSKAC